MNRFSRLGFALGLGFSLSLSLCASSVLAQQAPLRISDAWVRATVPGQEASGAYMEVVATEDSALVGASSPVAGVTEVHQMMLDGGVMKMRAAPRLALPAGKPVTLKPGGYHIMLMDLKQPLREGERVALQLRVEGKDGKVRSQEVQADVRSPSGAKPAMDAMHEHMHHH